MLNRCEFIGNLGRDPEIRNLKGGSKVANLSLAVSERWKDKNTGERKERTEWVRIVIFNENLVSLAEQYLHKGSRIFVAGQMATRKWKDQSGEGRYTTEVVLQRYRGELTMLDGKGDERGQMGTDGDEPQGGGDLDDEIPFAPA